MTDALQRRGWAGLADKALALCKMVQYRLWGSQTPLRQFKGVPTAILQQVWSWPTWSNPKLLLKCLRYPAVMQAVPAAGAMANLPIATCSWSDVTWLLAQVERKDLAWERWYDLSSQEIGEMIKAPKCDAHRLL